MQQLRPLDSRARVGERLDLLAAILTRDHQLEFIALAVAPDLVLNTRVLLPEEPKHFTAYRSQAP